MLERMTSTGWREALLWALLAAVVVEFALNIMEERTIWQRLTALEHEVHELKEK